MSDSTSQPPDTKMEVNDDLDQSVEGEINQDATQADAMNLDGANDDAPIANGLPEASTAFEQRVPAKKDATLREFLGKMDEYAPIVSPSAINVAARTTDAVPDTRCGHQLLPHTSRSAAATANIAASGPVASTRDAEIHRRYRSRRVPVLAHSVLEYHEQQPHGRVGRRSRSTRCSSSCARRQG